MAQTLLQVQRQIEQLRIAEAKLKKAEAAGVIAKMKVAIAAYGFTPEDLFDTRTRSTPETPTARTAPHKFSAPKKSPAKVNPKAKYADGNGNEWVGRGPRPLWLRTEIAAGRQLSAFLIKGAPAVPAADKAKAKAPQKKTGKQKVTIRFRDDKGNAWSGKGWMPLWMKAEIEATGKTKEDFRVK
jgi:DNA-binding protein H-NS